MLACGNIVGFQGVKGRGRKTECVGKGIDLLRRNENWL